MKLEDNNLEGAPTRIGGMSRRARVASLAGASIAVIPPLVACVLGFGSYLRYVWIVVLPILVLVSAGGAGLLAWAIHVPQPSRPAVTGLLLGAVLFFAGWFGGGEIRLAARRRIARRAEPLIQAIEEHRRINGRWPKALDEVKEWEHLVTDSRLSVREGRTGELRGTIDLSGVSDADMTVYLYEDGFLAIISVEQMVVMSFTSFKVLQRDNRSGGWEEERITWWLWGIRKTR